MKKFFVILSFVFMFVLVGVGASGVFAMPASFPGAQTSQVSGDLLNDYVTYNSIDKIFDVHEKDKVISITEKMNITFSRERTNVGWTRGISRGNKITRIVDGKRYVTKTISALSNVSLSIQAAGGQQKEEFFFIEKTDDYFLINAGADFDYKFGTYDYVLKYDYKMGRDFVGQFDDFTFDIMNYDFVSPVGHFSATINLPKSFLADGQAIEDVLSFRNGEANLTFEEVSFDKANFDGLSIFCAAQNIKPQEGITIQLILPQGYFKVSADVFYIFIIVIAALALAIAPLVLWLSKRGSKVVVTNEFYPPKGLSPLDVARVYRGKVKAEDISSLIIWWASKGLVSISKDGGRVVVKKLKEYDLDEQIDGFKKLVVKKSFSTRFLRAVKNMFRKPAFNLARKLARQSKNCMPKKSIMTKNQKFSRQSFRRSHFCRFCFSPSGLGLQTV